MKKAVIIKDKSRWVICIHNGRWSYKFHYKPAKKNGWKNPVTNMFEGGMLR